MPKVQEKVKEFFGREPRKDVNPDRRPVAVGARSRGRADRRAQGRVRSITRCRWHQTLGCDDEDDPEEHDHPTKFSQTF